MTALSLRPKGRSALRLRAVIQGFKGKRLLPFVDDLDPNRIHVQEPYEIIFLCGGRYTNIDDPHIVSFRDAFLKVLNNPVTERGEWVQAEDVTRRTDFFDSYNDILVFETDLAQIVKLIVLFCESEGSAAELGAFAATDEILKRLFVVVREHHWNEDSFIKLGPLRRIERKIGRTAIQVVSDDDVGIRGGQVSTIDKTALANQLQSSLAARISEIQEPSTFDPHKPGHIIKLIVGLIQEYGALTFQEISFALGKLNVRRGDDELRGYLLCARAVGWLVIVSRGVHDFYVWSNKGKDAATFYMKEDAKEKNKFRRRTNIREHWQKNDKARFGAMKVAPVT